MSVVVSDEPVVVSGAQSIALSTLFQIAPSSGNPTYLILNAFDRNEYAAGASDTTGTLSGAGVGIGLNFNDGDARETGIVFTRQAATGRYYNATVGYLDQLTYTASSSIGDITDLSLYGTSIARTANMYGTDAYSLMQYDPSGYLGSATVATLPGFVGPVPLQATPESIAAVAESFVGQAWNQDGCWILTSTIAAEAGAALPVASTADIAGQANGEWFVSYNGPAGSSGNWQSMVRAGDMIGFTTASGGGHITTCVAGSGSSAQLVDNVELVDQYGNILNPAYDGSAADIIVQSPHPASQEWSGVQASSVVIYRLDTPVVSTSVSGLTLAAGTQDSLALLFSATDPAGKAVTQYQVYTANPTDTLDLNGAAVAATSPAAAATVASLASISLAAGQAGGSDQVSVRAFNGAYWGDWTTLSVNTAGTTGVSTQTATPTATPTQPSAPSAPSNPVVSTQTAPITSDTISVYRFFDTADGTHFFTASATERDSLIATSANMSYEGVGLNAITPTGGDPAAEAVYRFFDVADGTHFYTASASERDSLIANSASMTFEGVAFYEDATQAAGDSPVYRFFDSVHGTHLYTESSAERATILTTRRDLTPEGIAFYAPSLS